MKKTMALALGLVVLFASGLFAKNAYELYNEAYDLYLVHDYKNAVRLFKEAIRQKPDFVKPYNKAGLAYAAMKKVDHAIFMYKKAAHIDPNYAESYYNAGVAYEIKYKDKNPGNEKAIESYKKAIELRNDNFSFARSSLNLAGLYRGLARYDEAIELIRNAIKAEPDFAELYNASGLVYLDSGLFDYAKKNFEKALKVQQRYPEASVNLGITFMKMGKLARAIKQFEETLVKDPNFAGAHYNYANALIVNGFYEKAKSHLNKAIALDPEMAEAYYSLGKAEEKMNRFDPAWKAYKTAIDKKKDFKPAQEAFDALKKKREEFRSHITFKKKAVEGEEGEGAAEDETELSPEQLAAKKKAKAEEEDVEDLRLPEDKPTPAEGEETEE